MAIGRGDNGVLYSCSMRLIYKIISKSSIHIFHLLHYLMTRIVNFNNIIELIYIL